MIQLWSDFIKSVGGHEKLGELKKSALFCPFCKKKKVDVIADTHGFPNVYCMICGAGGPSANTLELDEAFTLWNTRI